MKYIRELPSADEIKNQFSITNKQRMMREKRIQEIENVLSGKISKKIIILLCTIDN